MNAVDKGIATLRIVVTAMGGGVVSFAVIAIVLVSTGTIQPNASVAPMLLGVLGLLAVGELGGYVVFRTTFVGAVRRAWRDAPADDNPTEALFGRYQTLTLIGCAMAEGLGLFGAVVYLITANAFALAAPAVTVVALVLQFPTRDKAAGFAANITSDFR